MKLARQTAMVLVLALSACAADDGELPSEEGIAGEENGDSKGDRDDAAFTTFDAWASPPHDEIRKVFTSAAAYEEYFVVPAPPEVDWSRDWVVYYSAGLQPTGGYSAHIRRISVSETGRTLKVVVSIESPGPDCVVTQAYTTPYVLARFRKPASAPSLARFYHDDVTRSCSPPSRS